MGMLDGNVGVRMGIWDGNEDLGWEWKYGNLEWECGCGLLG